MTRRNSKLGFFYNGWDDLTIKDALIDNRACICSECGDFGNFRANRAPLSVQAEPRKGVGGLWPSFARSIIIPPKLGYTRLVPRRWRRRRRRAPSPTYTQRRRKVRMKGSSASETAACWVGRPVFNTKLFSSLIFTVLFFRIERLFVEKMKNWFHVIV